MTYDHKRWLEKVYEGCRYGDITQNATVFIHAHCERLRNRQVRVCHGRAYTAWNNDWLHICLDKLPTWGYKPDVEWPPQG